MPEQKPAREVATLVPGSGGPVLQLSMRRVHDLVAFCAPYELEDVVASVTGADRVEIDDYAAIEWSRRLYKLGRKALRSRAVARALVPRLPVPRLDREYELFFPCSTIPSSSSPWPRCRTGALAASARCA
jgi:hypothetical protein